MEAVHHTKNEIFVFTLGIDCDIVHNNFSWEWTSLPTFTSYRSGPGHGLRSTKSTTKCTVCSNGSGTNRKRIACQRYFNITRINCLNIEKSKKNRYTANCSYKWTCFECTVSLLPFCNLRITFPQPERYEHNEISDSPRNSCHVEILTKYKNYTTIAHINTQSILSTFEFSLMLNTYKFDTVAFCKT